MRIINQKQGYTRKDGRSIGLSHSQGGNETESSYELSQLRDRL